MDKNTKDKLSEILLLIYGLFSKDTLKQFRGNERNLSYHYYEVYKELLKIEDTKYLHVIDKTLINYIYDNDFLNFNQNIKDPVLFTKFIRLYVDYKEHGNYIYRNMTKYIYYMYLREFKLSKNKELNNLINEYHHIVKGVYHLDKLTLDEIRNFCRLLVFLLTYLYMNNELLENNEELFHDTCNVMINDSFFEEMKLNGIFSFTDKKEEENIKIYYIKKAIEEVKKRNDKKKIK